MDDEATLTREGGRLIPCERSTLDAFQSAAKQLGDDEVGSLVPFYRFYPAVEGFLAGFEGVVERAVEVLVNQQVGDLRIGFCGQQRRGDDEEKGERSKSKGHDSV